MGRIALSILVVAFCCSCTLCAERTNASDEDTAAIKQTALDYIEGWYEGSTERMERAVHPELAKRIVQTNQQNGQSRLEQMNAKTLVSGVRRGGGKATPKEKQQKDVTILDVYENAASVKIVAADWVDYLHLAKFNGRWVIVNVLWERNDTSSPQTNRASNGRTAAIVAPAFRRPMNCIPAIFNNH